MVGDIVNDTKAGYADQCGNKGCRLESRFGGNTGDLALDILAVALLLDLIGTVGLHALILGLGADQEEGYGQHDSGSDQRDGQITAAPACRLDDSSNGRIGNNAAQGADGQTGAINGTVILCKPVVDHAGDGRTAVEGTRCAHPDGTQIDLPQAVDLRHGCISQRRRNGGNGQHLAHAVFVHQFGGCGEGQRTGKGRHCLI